MESPGIFLTRLLALPGYEWDLEFPPFHSSYDNWHFFGTRLADTTEHTTSQLPDSSSAVPPPHAPRQTSSRTSTDTRPAPNSRSQSSGDVNGSPTSPAKERSIRVVARVSRHVLRLEREYQLCQQIWAKSNGHRVHFVRPIELVRVPGRNGETPLAIAIIEAPGPNYLRDLVPFGPGVYAGIISDGHWEMVAMQNGRKEISLSLFLEFAIGATRCLEILHHENQMVHGEIRGDAFHFNQSTGLVKMINFGSGARSFENGLTSAGWYSLSREHGIEHKLCFVAPEQTGRLPAQPDGRTDIYSLGVLLWSILTGETPFTGDTPLEVMQNVLSRRIPQVSTKRLDVPNVLSAVIAKMTQKNIDSRYNSISGLGYDLRQIKNFLDEGDSEGLASFQIATKDISTYFNLPNHQIGRKKEHDTIVDLMQQFCSKIKYTDSARQMLANGLAVSSSGGGFSQAILEIRSEANSLSEGSVRGSTSRGTGSSLNARSVRGMEPLATTNTNDPKAISESEPRPEENTSSQGKGNSLNRSVSIRDYAVEHTVERTSTTNSVGLSHVIDTAALLLRPPSGGKQNNHHCELVAISGSAGSGKSCMIQSIASAARLRGYFATGKFDQARKAPFDPILRILSSLFRQIFGEADVSTDFHHHIRHHVQPIWGVLHTYLDLPVWLLNDIPTGGISLQNPDMPTHPSARLKEQKSMPPEPSLSASSTDIAADWLRAGASTKSSRFTNLFLGVLNVIASRRFVCFCIDDLQFADSESLDMLLHMERSNIPIMLIVTNREEEQLSKRAKILISKAVKVELQPFTEEETAEYVSTTIHRSLEYVLPLVAIIQQKTGGNPFFIREMLSTCYRKRCISYSWTQFSWEYDIDKVFSEFVSSGYGAQMDNDFVTRRLQELPEIAQSVLAWASLIGSTFSFEFVKTLSENATNEDLDRIPTTKSQNPVTGLQSALGAFIIMSTDSDDRFRFAHDRYMQASCNLADRFDRTQMHYLIAKTLLQAKFRTADWAHQKSVHTRCRYVLLGSRLLHERLTERAQYRKILMDGAETALESGARSTAITYLVAALQLLQDQPWDETLPDVSYQETLRLHIRAAENHWYHNDLGEAMKLVQTVYKHARTELDMAPCRIIESRIYVRQGNNAKAFKCLRIALNDFEIPVPEITPAECDAQFAALHKELKTMDRAKLIENAHDIQPAMEVIGLLLTELSSAAFWSTQDGFVQAAMLMVRTHLDRGPYPQCALAYLQLGIVAISRYGLTKFGTELGDLSLALLDLYQDDTFTLGRVFTLHALFYGHLQAPLASNFAQLTSAWDASLASGDRILSMLNVGVTAAFRIWASCELSETEAFANETHAELTDFDRDLRGGVFIVGARQYARAMQGKTLVNSAENVLDDEIHQSAKYEAYLRANSKPSDPQETIYGSYKLAALYRYGHIDAAIIQGERFVGLSEAFYCSRLLYENMLYLCLAYCCSISADPEQTQRQQRMKKIENMLLRIETASEINDINLKAWKLLIEAQLAAVNGKYNEALGAYEAALDHCQAHGLLLDEAMILELYADLLLQRGARRPAHRMLHDAVVAYKLVGATGKVNHLYDRHSKVFANERNIGYAEIACQTEDVEVSDRSLKLPEAMDPDVAVDDRTNAWINPNAAPNSQVHVDLAMRTGNNDDELTNREFSAMGLDMIDLAGILESSQILSSELKIDKLMGKMAETITEIAAADIVGIVIKDERLEYSVSAIGTTDGVLTFEEGISMETDEVDRQLALQVTKYVLRFRETVFVHNLLEDDRFSSASATWLAENPGGKAVISLPIIHGGNDLLGAIYVEGAPNKFTERNLTVLRLLVNQISISLANAFVLKKIEKVSAENAAMVGVQRKALTHARTAEGKAKDAQVEAERNMRLKEEASKAKSMFLANVSHELRTPLNGVLGMSELLKSTNLTDKQAEYADSIRICADTLLAVINDLLDFTKLDAGKMNIKKDPLDLSKVITEVVRALSFQNNQKGLKTVTELELDSDLILLGDSMRLHQILMNLLSNSYKFTLKGGVTVRAVLIKEESDHVTITITVKDTGIGVPKEQRQKLFQPFSQVENNSSRSFQGTGLGLSICKALVENLMGGKIWLESEAGEGTTVGFTIRFAKASKEQVERMAEAQRHFQQNFADGSLVSGPTIRRASIYTPDSSPGEAGPSSPELPHKVDVPHFADVSSLPRDDIRVCIAEDNMINQKIAISFVQRLGFECDAFVNGRVAIEALSKAAKAGKPYRIVLMDVQMPVLDGYDATREIRRHVDPDVRDVLIIAMTASAIQGDREKCLEAGMNDYLAKPVRAQTLKDLLESYLDPTSRRQSSPNPVMPIKGERSMKPVSEEGTNELPSKD